MKVMAYEGVVENGCVQLPPEVSLPDKAKVYVVVPEVVEVDTPQSLAFIVPGWRSQPTLSTSRRWK